MQFEKKYVKIIKKYFKVIVMYIKNVEIQKTAALAPMAGVADKAFRLLSKDFGAAYTVSEMVSAKGVSMGDKKSAELMFIDSAEHPSAVQIFGNEPDTMAKAAITAAETGADIIDINMGCPAPKIVKGGAGSKLMLNPQLAGEIINAVSNSVNIPVTVKIRSGWDFDKINAVDMAVIAEKNGAAAVTVHGRTKEQMYAPPVNLNIIKDVKNAVAIPVIGNGDITDALSAAKMYEETGCDLVMVGRGALGKPWIFQQISAYMNNEILLPDPPVSQRMLIMMKHIESICNEKGEYNGIKEARKHALWYTKGLRGSAEYRRQLSAINSIEELAEIAFMITKNNE